MSIDRPDRVVRRKRGAGHEERSATVDREMVGGDTGLQCCVNEDFALRVDLEYRAAAITHKKIAVGIEHRACCHAHPFGIERRLAGPIDAIDISFRARGYK